MQDRQNVLNKTILLLHGVLYTILWAMAMYGIFFSPAWVENESRILPALVWLPVLIAHVALYFRANPASEKPHQDTAFYRDGYRDGYREGYRDGLQGTLDEYDSRRLALGEDGELVEWEGKQKRE